jgi:hypothetical protein
MQWLVDEGLGGLGLLPCHIGVGATLQGLLHILQYRNYEVDWAWLPRERVTARCLELFPTRVVR